MTAVLPASVTPTNSKLQSADKAATPSRRFLLVRYFSIVCLIGISVVIAVLYVLISHRYRDFGRAQEIDLRCLHASRQFDYAAIRRNGPRPVDLRPTGRIDEWTHHR